MMWWCDDVMMMMMIMMMMVMMMIMTIVSVEQRPGWGEHVFIEFWTLVSSIHGLCTASELRGTSGNLQNVYQITYSSGHSHRAPDLIMCKPLQTKDCAKMVKFADKATSKKYSKYKTPMEYVILLVVNYVCIYIHIISYPMCCPLFVPKTTSQSQIYT